MTASNLGICIGFSLLYPREQSSNTYTNSSTIIELMITNYKQLFPEDTQQDLQSLYQTQPDVSLTIHQNVKYLLFLENSSNFP